MKYLILLIFFGNYAFAINEVYESYDKDGNLVISNIKNNNNKVMELPDLKIITPESLSFEENRKEILKNELKNEKQALKESSDLLAKIKLMKNKDNQSQIDTVNDAIKEHQKNIIIINKQLNI